MGGWSSCGCGGKDSEQFCSMDTRWRACLESRPRDLGEVGEGGLELQLYQE